MIPDDSHDYTAFATPDPRPLSAEDADVLLPYCSPETNAVGYTGSGWCEAHHRHLNVCRAEMTEALGRITPMDAERARPLDVERLAKALHKARWSYRCGWENQPPDPADEAVHAADDSCLASAVIGWLAALDGEK